MSTQYRMIRFEAGPAHCETCYFLRPPEYCALERRKLKLDQEPDLYGKPIRSDDCVRASREQSR